MSSHYLHGAEPEEQRRLTALNELLNASSLRETAIRPGERVVDFGCGLAQLTRAMARAAGLRAVGIERDADQLAEAARQARAAGEEALLELRRGEVAAPPLAEGEWGAFDVAHARFVLEHMSDPQAVVHAMVRAVRPGGRVVLEDDDHDPLRFWPEEPAVLALWNAYIATYVRVGNDPAVGRKLVALLYAAGAAPRRSTWIWFAGCAGEPHFPMLVENAAGLFAGARAEIEATGLAPARVDEGIAALRAWGRRPDAAFWFARCWAEGVRRG